MGAGAERKTSQELSALEKPLNSPLNILQMGNATSVRCAIALKKGSSNPHFWSFAGSAATGQVVLIELAERKAALIVDEFVGQQEIVVKQFDGVSSSKTLFSGATILGDGSPALIVEASSLL